MTTKKTEITDHEDLPELVGKTVQAAHWGADKRSGNRTCLLEFTDGTWAELQADGQVADMVYAFYDAPAPVFHNYVVSWCIDIESTSPEAAAEQALNIQRDMDSIATVFVVKDDAGVETTVDLTPGA
jgi:hypothetical protein